MTWLTATSTFRPANRYFGGRLPILEHKKISLHPVTKLTMQQASKAVQPNPRRGSAEPDPGGGNASGCGVSGSSPCRTGASLLALMTPKR